MLQLSVDKWTKGANTDIVTTSFTRVTAGNKRRNVPCWLTSDSQQSTEIVKIIASSALNVLRNYVVPILHNERINHTRVHNRFDACGNVPIHMCTCTDIRMKRFLLLSKIYKNVAGGVKLKEKENGVRLNIPFLHFAVQAKAKFKRRIASSATKTIIFHHRGELVRQFIIVTNIKYIIFYNI